MTTRNGNGNVPSSGSRSSSAINNNNDTEDDGMIAAVLSEEYANLDAANSNTTLPTTSRLSNLAPLPVCTTFTLLNYLLFVL